MKISYSWIKEFIDLDVDVHTAASALTMSGTEVEDIIHQDVPGEIICARILEAVKHPNADKLFVCKVDTGKETLQVVCGAPNTRAGLTSAFAPVGCVLGPDMVIKKAKIRGEESFGMLLSEKELGLTDDHSGIMEITDANPGDVLGDALRIEDWVLEVNVTPNRGDSLSVIGIARELAALFGKTFKEPEYLLKEEEKSVDSVLRVEISSSDACPRYTARFMDGISIRKSPFYLRRRLFQSGVRAISNVVDITNYVMLEYGQPLHAFDSTLITDGAIIVRKATDGERFVTLDSIERELSKDDLLICDKKKAVALAGIMGGENSEVLDTTNSVILESAYFTQSGIRKTSKKLSLSTEASYRFERGIDPKIQDVSSNRAAYLMSKYCDARIYKGIIDINYLDYKDRKVALRRGYIEKVLGISDIEPSDIERIFRALGCDVVSSETGWVINVPHFRHDLTREIDLVEEFIRVYGMDKVKPSLPTFRPDKADSKNDYNRSLRLYLSAIGLTEIITYSFISPRWKSIFNCETLDLLNPISDEMKTMRMSLLPGIAEAIKNNRKFSIKDVSLFEIGKCFVPNSSQKLPDEYYRLGIAMTGQRFDAHWSEKGRPVDFYDIKGIAEKLLGNIALSPSEHPIYKQGFQANIFKEDKLVGNIGSVNNNILSMLDFEGDIYFAEVSLDAVLDKTWQGLKDIPKFPSTWRDLSLVIPESVTYDDITKAIKNRGINEVRKIEPVDLYTGDKLPAEMKGLTIRITYQSDSRTLEDNMINEWQDGIVKTLTNDFNITLRQ